MADLEADLRAEGVAPARSLEADLQAEGVETGPTLRGGAESFARGATLGISDQAQAAVAGLLADDYSHGRDEALAEIEQRRAAMGGLGTALEFGGAIAPGLVSGGTGTMAGIARALPAAVAERMAAAGTATTVSLAEQLGYRFGSTVMGRIATNVAKGGMFAGGAGAVQALADKTPEILTHPGEVAEYVLMQGLKNTLFGAAVSGVIGVAGEAAGSALRLGSRGAEEVRSIAAKKLPALAEQRAVKSVTRGGKGPPGEPPNVGEVLLNENLPLYAPEETLPILQQRADAASKYVLDLEQQVASGQATPELLQAARTREQALVWARDAAQQSAAEMPGRMAGEMRSALADAAAGAAAGVLMGAPLTGALGALGRRAGKAAVRVALKGQGAGYEALAFQQLAKLAADKTIVAGIAAAGQAGVTRVAQGALRATVQAGRILEPMWTGAMLDHEIAQAQQLTDPSSPARVALTQQRDQLEMAVPGLGVALESASMRRAQMLAAGAPARAAALYTGVPLLDTATRQKLGEQLRAMTDPDMEMARVEAGQATPVGVDTLRTLYPRAWSRFAGEMATQLSVMARASIIPTYRDQEAIGIQTGITTTPSLEPRRLAYGYSASKSAPAQATMSQPQKSQRKWGTPAEARERYGDKADQVATRRGGPNGAD